MTAGLLAPTWGLAAGGVLWLFHRAVTAGRSWNGDEWVDKRSFR